MKYQASQKADASNPLPSQFFKLFENKSPASLGMIKTNHQLPLCKNLFFPQLVRQTIVRQNWQTALPKIPSFCPSNSDEGTRKKQIILNAEH